MTGPPSDWQDWRRSRRAVLLALRAATPADERARLDDRLLDLLRTALPPLAGLCLGLYWPVRGEPDLRRLARLPSVSAALPVVRRRDAPLEFHGWRPGEPVRAAGLGVRVPVRQEVVRPDVVLAPLLGFDPDGYRLGYGSGCYDRTLAAMQPLPLVVGVGYEMGRLASIHPRWHDVPMGLLVTEHGARPPQRQRLPAAGARS